MHELKRNKIIKVIFQWTGKREREKKKNQPHNKTAPAFCCWYNFFSVLPRQGTCHSNGVMLKLSAVNKVCQLNLFTTEPRPTYTVADKTHNLLLCLLSKHTPRKLGCSVCIQRVSIVMLQRVQIQSAGNSASADIKLGFSTFMLSSLLQ